MVLIHLLVFLLKASRMRHSSEDRSDPYLKRDLCGCSMPVPERTLTGSSSSRRPPCGALPLLILHCRYFSAAPMRRHSAGQIVRFVRRPSPDWIDGLVRSAGIGLHQEAWFINCEWPGACFGVICARTGGVYIRYLPRYPTRRALQSQRYWSDMVKHSSLISINELASRLITHNLC